MKDLYNTIKESIFDDEDVAIDALDADVWLSNQDPLVARGVVKNGKIDASIIRNADGDEDVIFPDYIKFSNIDSLLLYTRNSNYDYSKFPDTDLVTACIINPTWQWGQTVDINLKNIPVKKIKYLYADTKQSNYISFPSCPVEETYIKRIYACADREYEDNEYVFNFDSLKTLNTKKLIIGDLLVTEDSLLFKHFYGDVLIPKEWDEYKKIDQFYQYTTNLYIIHEGLNASKYHKVTKTDKGFVIAKRGFKLK
jgi:hypothetical protein